MIIEFSNAKPAKSQSGLSIALLVLSCLFFFIPASLVVLGYYSSLPTGTLISPIPQGVLSTNTPPVLTEAPVIAAPDVPVEPIAADAASNATQKTAMLPATLLESSISDPEILESSQIFLLNKPEDKSLYTIKSKSAGQFIITANSPSESDRYVDYQIVNQ